MLTAAFEAKALKASTFVFCMAFGGGEEEAAATSAPKRSANGSCETAAEVVDSDAKGLKTTGWAEEDEDEEEAGEVGAEPSAGVGDASAKGSQAEISGGAL